MSVSAQHYRPLSAKSQAVLTLIVGGPLLLGAIVFMSIIGNDGVQALDIGQKILIYTSITGGALLTSLVGLIIWSIVKRKKLAAIMFISASISGFAILGVLIWALPEIFQVFGF